MRSTVPATSGLSSTRMFGSLGKGSGNKPLRCRSKVDLPAPLGPSTPMHSLGATENDTFSKATRPRG